MRELYADIIVDISHENLDHTFSYRIPSHLSDEVVIGSRVLIPFGAGNRRISGFVLGISDKSKYDPGKVKDIISVTGDDALVEQKLIRLAYWMKNRYGSTMNRALSTVLPVKKKIRAVEQRDIVLLLSDEEAAEKLDHFVRKHMVARARLLEELIREHSIDYRLVTGKLNISASTIRALAEQGILEVRSKRVYRNTVNSVSAGDAVTLLPAQKSIADDFCGEYDSGIRNTYLIHGITGSGKTEVYMEMISHVVSKGRQVIVLIPEISLTYQTVMRFYKRFGDRVSTLHSRLSDGERYDQFERARKHEIDIMIGPRSALFTPFDDLGLIVIDEEHEHTYKSDQMPKYHAKEVATELAKLHDASVVLGSATPSVGSYNAALSGKYKLYTLTERAQGALLPDVVSVDLRDELKSGNRSIFSSKLREAVGERLRRGEQVMLFLNRRGYAGFVSCRSCGTVVKCPHCDVSLSKHRNGKLVCHYCGYEQGTVKVCGKCGSKMIGQMGIGTEAVEEQIKELFPYASVLRMDADTTKQKGDYESILSTFANREADILVGTQMIVKGHDFPYVTLVGILAADMSLNANDYRAGERTFQLLVQAAGRAGRADRPGEVIIQTYRPEHYAIQAAMKQDYRAFYDEEMIYRAALSYPPCGHMLALITESMDETEGVNFADALARTIADGIIGRAVMIGPTAASIGRIKDVYRRMIYVKSADTAVLTGVKDAAEAFFDRCGNKGLRISFDLDPMNGY